MARYIDLEELERRIKEHIKAETPEEKALIEWCKDECIRQAYAMPTADVAPKSEGWWLYHEDSCSYICSECEEYAITDYYGEPKFTKYCPNCGAKMKGGAE